MRRYLNGAGIWDEALVKVNGKRPSEARLEIKS
jgi:hypothetical protein